MAKNLIKTIDNLIKKGNGITKTAKDARTLNSEHLLMNAHVEYYDWFKKIKELKKEKEVRNTPESDCIEDEDSVCKISKFVFLPGNESPGYRFSEISTEDKKGDFFDKRIKREIFHGMINRLINGIEKRRDCLRNLRINLSRLSQKEKKELDKKKQIMGSPKFNENPPQIIWGEIIVPIPEGSYELYACRVLFKKNLGETVSWDEIMEKIIGDDNFEKKDWRKVYDTILRINKKVKNKTGKNIFKTSRKSFSRIK